MAGLDLAVAQVQVGPADAARVDAQEQLAGTRLGHLDIGRLAAGFPARRGASRASAQVHQFVGGHGLGLVAARDRSRSRVLVAARPSHAACHRRACAV